MILINSQQKRTMLKILSTFCLGKCHFFTADTCLSVCVSCFGGTFFHVQHSVFWNAGLEARFSFVHIFTPRDWHRSSVTRPRHVCVNWHSPWLVRGLFPAGKETVQRHLGQCKCLEKEPLTCTKDKWTNCRCRRCGCRQRHVKVSDRGQSLKRSHFFGFKLHLAQRCVCVCARVAFWFEVCC